MVVKIRVPFWVPIIIRHLLFRAPKKGPLILTTTHISAKVVSGDIRLMDKILHDPKDPKLWELWYIPYYGSCRILSINRRECYRVLEDLLRLWMGFYRVSLRIYPGLGFRVSVVYTCYLGLGGLVCYLLFFWLALRTLTF